MPPKGGIIENARNWRGMTGQMPQGEGPATQGTPDKV